MAARKTQTRAARRPIRLRTIVLLLVLFPFGYLAATYGPAYWGYLRMLTPLREAARAAAAQRWDAGIERQKQAWRDELIAKASDLGVALAEDGIAIEKAGGEAVVRAVWRVPVYHPTAQHEIELQLESRQPFLPN